MKEIRKQVMQLKRRDLTLSSVKLLSKLKT